MLHGICYAFFFATVYIFVDEFFPKDARASAQGLFNLMILGFGPLVANTVGPKLMGETFNRGGSWISGACSWCRGLGHRRRRRAGAVLPSADKTKTRVGVPVTSH